MNIHADLIWFLCTVTDYKLDPLFIVAFLKKEGINYER